MTHWIAPFDTPRIILSDNASSFYSTDLQAKLTSMNITKATTVPLS